MVTGGNGITRGPQPPNHGLVMVCDCVYLVAKQEVSGGRVVRLHLYFMWAPHCSHYCLSSASCQISSSIINGMCLNHPETFPPPHCLRKNCFLQNQSLAPKRLGTICIADWLEYWTLGNANFRIRQTDQSSNPGSSNFCWFELKYTSSVPPSLSRLKNKKSEVLSHKQGWLLGDTTLRSYKGLCSQQALTLGLMPCGH